MPATGPTLATAIGSELPNLSVALGSPFEVFGVRPGATEKLDAGNHRMSVSVGKGLDDWDLNPYRVSHAPIPMALELYDVKRELQRVKAALDEAVADCDCDYSTVFNLRDTYGDSLDKLLVYDPDAKIKRKQKLDEVCRDFRSPPIYEPSPVTIRRLAVVERGDAELLLRFEYYFTKPSVMSVHGRAIEFADRIGPDWRIRTGRLSALRGVFPPFTGIQLPQVHHDLQVALNAAPYGGTTPGANRQERASQISLWSSETCLPS